MSASVPDPAAASSTRCQQSAPRSGHRAPASNPQQLLYQRLQELRIGQLLFDFDRPVTLGVPLNFDVRTEHEEDGAYDCESFKNTKIIWIRKKRSFVPPARLRVASGHPSLAAMVAALGRSGAQLGAVPRRGLDMLQG